MQLKPFQIYLCLSDAVVSTFDYESAGPSSIPDEGNQRTAHPAVHLPKRVDEWVSTDTWGR